MQGNVVIAIDRDVSARRWAGITVIARKSIGLIIETSGSIDTSELVASSLLYSDMAISPKTQHKGRYISMAQAKMTEHCEYQHNRKPSFKAE
ncbi:hypothetical protein CWO84_09980 [Methylomonas sp. Kb3]|nr:hypothetical protein CWO84_09980 [Methylomonas sp. Kb3]